MFDMDKALQILRLKVKGQHLRAISEEMGYSRQTVNETIRDIRRTLEEDPCDKEPCEIDLFHYPEDKYEAICYGYSQSMSVWETSLDTGIPELEIYNVLHSLLLPKRTQKINKRYPNITLWAILNNMSLDEMGSFCGTPQLQSSVHNRRTSIKLDVAKKVSAATGMTLEEIYSAQLEEGNDELAEKIKEVEENVA